MRSTLTPAPLLTLLALVPARRSTAEGPERPDIAAPFVGEFAEFEARRPADQEGGAGDSVIAAAAIS